MGVSLNVMIFVHKLTVLQVELRKYSKALVDLADVEDLTDLEDTE